MTDVLKLNQTINDHAFVKAVLAERKKNNNTLAAILVGQDLPFNYNSSSWFICPALRDWMEIERASPPMPANVLGWFENIDMSISLLMPDQSDDPPTRTSAGDVSQAFLKFANDRKKVYPSEVAVFHNPQLVGGDQLHAPDYPELRMLGGNLTVNGNTTQADLDALGKKSLKLFALLGHGTPDNIEATPLIPLTARELGNIDVPLAILDGCHTYCWYNFTGKLSSTGDFFGNNVLSNFSQRAVVAGMPVWVEVEPDPPNFLSHAVPILARGKSLAQAVYGSSSMHGDGNEVFYTVIYGDITFHY